MAYPIIYMKKFQTPPLLFQFISDPSLIEWRWGRVQTILSIIKLNAEVFNNSPDNGC